MGKWGGDRFEGYWEVKRGGIGMWMERRELQYVEGAEKRRRKNCVEKYMEKGKSEVKLVYGKGGGKDTEG